MKQSALHYVRKQTVRSTSLSFLNYTANIVLQEINTEYVKRSKICRSEIPLFFFFKMLALLEHSSFSFTIISFSVYETMKYQYQLIIQKAPHCKPILCCSLCIHPEVLDKPELFQLEQVEIVCSAVMITAFHNDVVLDLDTNVPTSMKRNQI